MPSEIDAAIATAVQAEHALMIQNFAATGIHPADFLILVYQEDDGYTTHHMMIDDFVATFQGVLPNIQAALAQPRDGSNTYVLVRMAPQPGGTPYGLTSIDALRPYFGD